MKLIAQKKQLVRILEILERFRPFILKKVSLQSKNGSCDANFRGDGPKEIGAKVTSKGFFNS